MDDPYELIDAAWDLLHRRDQIVALERAIAAADAQGDLDAGFEARTDHLTACTFGGAADRALTSFAWCLARHDEDPARFGSMNWQYKWIANGLPEFAEVPRARIDEVVADMERRFAADGNVDVPVAKVRWLIAAKLGELESAERWCQEWLDRQRVGAKGSLSDCVACDVGDHAHLLAQLGRHEEAIQVAAPIFGEGLSCEEIPHRTFGELLPSMVLTGREILAVIFQDRGYQLIRSNPSFLGVLAAHVDYLRWAGRHSEAVDLAATHLGWLDHVRSDIRRFRFLSAVSRVVASIDETSQPNEDNLKRLTAVLTDAEGRPARPGPAREGTAGTTVALEIATALDERNGNRYYRDLHEQDPFSPVVKPSGPE